MSTQSQKSQKHQPKSEKYKKGHIELTLGREVFMTSQPDLLSIPFDYEAEIMVKDKHVHRHVPIHERIVEIDQKIEELRLKRDLQERFPKAQESIYPGEDSQIIETSDRVKNWHRDRADREARLAKRREKEARKADEKIKEENEKKDKDRRLQKRIRLANCEARIHEMNHYRVERDQMNRYQNKVVGELLRHPRTFYYYQASEEALQKVKDKLKAKFHSHKVKLDEQQGRLEYYERQFGEQE
jgi:hypothetical protein